MCALSYQECLDRLDLIRQSRMPPGIPAPNTQALILAEVQLEALADEGLLPDSLGPARSGGIALSYGKPGRWLSVICRNDNTLEILTVTDQLGPATLSIDSIGELFDRVRRFRDGEG